MRYSGTVPKDELTGVRGQSQQWKKQERLSRRNSRRDKNSGAINGAPTDVSTHACGRDESRPYRGVNACCASVGVGFIRPVCENIKK